MSSRLAACEACRRSKLACDHKRPVCTRCRNSNRSGLCIYRASPFKRKRDDSSPLVDQHSNRPSPASPPLFSPRRNPYPNPGYLGSSSHAAIFNHIPQGEDNISGSYFPRDAELPADPSHRSDDGNLLTHQGADVLRQLLDKYSLKLLKELVMFWLKKGINLILAGPFVQQCVESMTDFLMSSLQDENWHLIYARRLLHNSAQPLDFNRTSSLSSFSAQFLNQNVRWESLGIFFSAVSRATFDISFFPSLYTTEQEQYALRRLSTKLTDCALDIALSLDCLNDLQLVFQYENFIVHSCVDGDQSYHSWRRLGDVIASIFALGYHEDIETRPEIPPFLIDLRKAAFANTYGDDKNVSIFLGRPPRMSKQFCHFQLPSCPTSLSDSSTFSSRESNVDGWEADTKFSYTAQTRWSALCAFLKEEVLELYGEKNHETRIQKASVIQSKAEAEWHALPAHFRLECSLKQCNQGPFERDFLASVRLNYLHVLFLLRLLLLKTPSEPDNSIVEVAEKMLVLTVEAILLRDQLINSGDGLIWKVAHYGLPAAGIILLAMLKQRNTPSTAKMWQSRVLQNLSVLVAEIQIGTLIKPGEPNYALFSKATHTIQKFLDSVHSTLAKETTPLNYGNDDWTTYLTQDFEVGFWQNLAEHPSLLTLDHVLPAI
ncbi:hypothetical protein L228DRAFT_257174 [Xylona heveae TC161]|uniref:Zn(2)-C6 fungal-type domain-containing protein n=1 Tax=Xylona heveae (strain CBS 132557 / TC161) TaxID=1328760 RepID=A0A164ZGV3_XYLHT|nr:hypothetical protein L228DRAFT_257174 [Xylona heveae TC161]KZF19088.1 hypothetical protein L228DRAFT_257174 [Xylona heveae TC161]